MPTPKTPPILTSEALDLLASWFRVLSEPSRLRILHALKGGELNISELVEATGLSQTNVSRHVQSLVGAQIVGRRREGLNSVCYIADDAIFTLCESVCSRLELRLRAQVAAMSS